MHVAKYEPEPEDGGILARLRSGLVHARERRPALPALSMVAMLSLFGVSHSAILPVYAQDVLGNVEYFTWIVVATGAGAMLGALSIGYRSQVPSMRSAAALMLAFSVAMARVRGVARSADRTRRPVRGGLDFYFAVMTSLQTLVQSIVHESKRGRVMSLFQVAWAGLVPLGGLAMGAAAGAIGVTTALGLGACICGLYAAAVLVWARTALSEVAPA